MKEESLMHLELLQFGNQEGLKYYMSKYGQALRFFAFKIVRNKEVVDEILSDSFFKLWRDREKFHTEQYLKSFIYTVTRNACLDYIYSNHKRQEWDDIDGLSDLLKDKSDIHAKIVYVEALEQLMIEISKLPTQQAEVFRLSFIEGLESDEISRILNTSLNNVYYARSKALAAIKLSFTKKGLYSSYVILSVIFSFGIKVVSH